MATKASNDLRLVAGALVLGALVIGWFFILWQNKFHATAPVMMLCLGYLAVVATIANLWRVGAAAVAPEDATAEAWSRPLGERDELEKEKKTLLKAIKEAEFDLAMGKLSKVDADQLITMYRTRAIAVIKEIERLDGIAAAADTRGQIEREIAARLALEGANKKKNKAAKAAAKAAKAEAKAAEKAKAAAKAGKFAEPPKAKPADADDDADDEDEDDEHEGDESAESAESAAKAIERADLAAAEAPGKKRPTRPSQRSFTTSDEGDSTPLPPPTSHADVEDSKPGELLAKTTEGADANAEAKPDAKSDASAKSDKFADPPKSDGSESKDSKSKEAS